MHILVAFILADDGETEDADVDILLDSLKQKKDDTLSNPTCVPLVSTYELAYWTSVFVPVFVCLELQPGSIYFTCFLIVTFNEIVNLYFLN